MVRVKVEGGPLSSLAKDWTVEVYHARDRKEWSACWVVTWRGRQGFIALTRREDHRVRPIVGRVVGERILRVRDDNSISEFHGHDVVALRLTSPTPQEDLYFDNYQSEG